MPRKKLGSEIVRDIMKEKEKEGLVVTDAAVVNWVLFIMTFFLQFILKEVKHFFSTCFNEKKTNPDSTFSFLRELHRPSLTRICFSNRANGVHGQTSFKNTLVIISHN